LVELEEASADPRRLAPPHDLLAGRVRRAVARERRERTRLALPGAEPVDREPVADRVQEAALLCGIAARPDEEALLRHVLGLVAVSQHAPRAGEETIAVSRGEI